MKLLVVAATEAEIGPFLQQIVNIDVLITGVGMVATTYGLTRKLAQNDYDLVIQAGVGGSFDETIPLGSIVFVTADSWGDLGAEDNDKYIDIYDLGLLGKDELPHTAGMLRTPIQAVHNNIHLPQVKGITVNTVSGSVATIARRRQYGCEVESMEGAAFHYVCLREGVAFAQVRAISNYVIPRDKSQWRMKDAIINLNNWLIEFTGKLQ